MQQERFMAVGWMRPLAMAAMAAGAVSVGIAAERHVKVPMRDGTRIDTYYKTPAADGPWPAVLKKGYSMTTRDADAFVKAGYVYVSQGTRRGADPHGISGDPRFFTDDVDGYDTRDSPKLLIPGKVYEFTLTLLPTARVFRKGHQIRLHLSSSRFPLWDRNTNTGNGPATDRQTRVAHQTVYHDASRPSHIILPLIPINDRKMSGGKIPDGFDFSRGILRPSMTWSADQTRWFTFHRVE